jgi:hypothetical protein
MPANLDIRITATDAATPVFGKVQQSASGLSSSLSESLGKGITNVISGLGQLKLAADGVQTVFDGIKGIGSAFGIGALSELEQTRASFMAFTKDAAKTEQILQQVRDEAAKTPFSFGEMAKAAASLMPVAKQSGMALMDLVKEAEILAASNPTEGLEGASFALREAMTGDFTSIIERFNLSRQTINQLKAEGVPALEIVRRAMAEMGFDSDLIAAKAETLEGRWSTFKDTLQTLQMRIGQPIFDTLKEGLVGLQGALDTNMPLMESMADLIAGGLRRAIDSGKETISGLVAVWNSLREGFERGGIIGAIQNLGPMLGQALSNLGNLIASTVEGWARRFAAWVDGAEQLQGSELAAMAQALYTWIGTAAAAIVEKLGQWAGAFVDWVGPKIPPLLAALGDYLSSMLGWVIDTALPAIIGKLAEWGLAFVEWIGPRIPPLLAALGGLLLQLVGWIAFTALPAIIGKLGEWALAFVTWVPGAIVDLLYKLGELEFRLLGWIGDRVGDLARAALDLGSGLVGGIRDGIADALGWFWSWLQDNFIDRIPGFVREMLGIRSPSGVFIDIGRNIVEGLRVGMERRLPSIDELIERMVGRIADVGEVADWLRAAMRIAGVGDDWLRGLVRLVDLESSGNPRARNPESVNGEHASGLLQTLPSTFRSYRDRDLPNDIFNPVANAVAAIRYISDTYGHVNKIPGLFSGRFRGYAEGGIAWNRQLAWVAEREPELIVPLSRLRPSPAGGGGGVYIAPGAIVVQGSLVHERDLEQVVMAAIGGGLRHGIQLGGGR